jgi:hypothetical protein
MLLPTRTASADFIAISGYRYLCEETETEIFDGLLCLISNSSEMSNS